jgi:uncharacterized delta-60 repeat protein
MKKLLCLLPALLALALPATTSAKAGQLDRGFGGTGKVTAFLETRDPARPAPEAYLAWAPDGKIVVAAGTALVEYLRNGRPDRSFGEEGRVTVAPAPGGITELAGVKVDSRGRILVAGTVSRSPWSASGFVSRYFADGRPDPSFGNGGTVLTTLGLAAPAPVPSNDLPFPPAPPSEGPIVKVLGLALDAADRPVLSGVWTSEFRVCYPFTSYSPRDTGLLARLGENGALDPSFGNNGVRTDPIQEENLSPLLDDGGILFVGARPNCNRGSALPSDLERTDENGQTDPSFGSSGRLSFPFGARPALARDRFGRILAFGTPFESEFSFLQRLTARGTADRRFGKGGSVRFLREGETESAALAADRRGRPVLAFGRREFEDRAGFLIVRRRRDGRLDRSFSEDGQVTTYFGADALPQQVLIGGGSKIVVGGTISRPDNYRIALVRYNAR